MFVLQYTSIMRRSIQYQFFFQAVGDPTFKEIEVEADYLRQEVQAFDLNGDLSNMDDVFEQISIKRLYDVTLGIDLKLIEIPVDLRRSIVNAGLRFVNKKEKYYEHSEC